MKKINGFLLAVLFFCGPSIAVFTSEPSWAKRDLHAQRIPDLSSSVSVTVTVASGKSEDLLPKAFSLSQNYPNPFNPETVIKYALPEDCDVELVIYNILGQQVKVLVNAYQNAGYKAVHWNGRDDGGNEIASGLYFYKIKTPKYSETKKMILLR
jgi:flagellar hook assembly protein FlgD